MVQMVDCKQMLECRVDGSKLDGIADQSQM